MSEVANVIFSLLIGAFLAISIIALWKCISFMDSMKDAITYVATEVGEISQTLEDYVYEPEDGENVPTDDFEEPDLYKRDEYEDDSADNWKP